MCRVLLLRNPGDPDPSSARHLVAAVDVDEHGGQRLRRRRVADRPGMEPTQSDIRAEPDHDLAGAPVVAADEHVAVDRVVEVAQMLRGDVLKGRYHPYRLACELLDR